MQHIEITKYFTISAKLLPLTTTTFNGLFSTFPGQPG